MQKVLFANVYQKVKNQTIGFSLLSKTRDDISSQDIFWWLVENIIDWQIRPHEKSSFDLTRNINIDFQINDKRQSYIFYETKSEVITVRYFLKKKYTLRLDNKKGYSTTLGLTNLEPYINYLEWSVIRQNSNYSPLINVPM